MITVKIGDTIFTCDTPAQAVQIHQMAGSASVVASTPKYPTMAPVVSARLAIDPDAHNMPFAFIEHLKPLDGQYLDSTKMKELVGVQSEHGVGPRLAAWRRLLAKHSPPILLNDYITAQKNNSGTMIWAVHSGSGSGK